MFIKDWTLPIAMMVGVLSYFAFKDLEALEPLLPAARWVSSHFPPWLIFFMLLFTFTKIHPKDLWPRKVHLWLLLVQVAGSVGVYLLLHPFNEVVAQSAMICIICPTATAAAIITEKLGGKVDALITYVIEINLVVSVFVPAVFPLIEPHEGLTFFQAFLCGVIYWIGNCSFARAYFVFSKPLVAGFLVGLVFGQPLQGAMIGAEINMIYLGWIGAGGASPADPCAAGVLSTAFVLATGLDMDAALVLAVPVGLVAIALYTMLMTVMSACGHLCQKFIETDKTYEEFVSERDDYLKKLNNSAEETVEDESFFENLRDFIVKYKYVIILIAIITGVGVFVIVKKKSRIV